MTTHTVYHAGNVVYQIQVKW